MKFYKEADGDWIINGEIIPAGTCRQKTESATGRITIKLIGAPLLESTLALKMLPTDFQDVNGNYYADLAAYELATSDFFVDAALAAAEQLEVDLGVEVQERTSEDANLQNQINTVVSGYLGAIAYNAPAPTPAKNGWYDFSTGGVVSWLTGTPTVKIGDRVSVLYTNPTYVYTYQNINLNYIKIYDVNFDESNNILTGSTWIDKVITNQNKSIGVTKYGDGTSYSGWVKTDKKNIISNKIKLYSKAYNSGGLIIYPICFFDGNDFLIDYLLTPSNTSSTIIIDVPLNAVSYCVQAKDGSKDGQDSSRLTDWYLYVNKLIDLSAAVSNIFYKNNFMKVLCVGDSLTEGDYGSDPAGTANVHSKNYPYYLAKYLGTSNVYNLGRSGYTASVYWNNNVIQNFDFQKFLPNVIVIMISANAAINDGLSTDVEPFNGYLNYANTQCGCYCKIIEYCMERTSKEAQIFLCQTPHVGIKRSGNRSNAINSYSPVLKIAERYSLPVIDLFKNGGFSDFNQDVMQPIDNLHFSEIGYSKMGTFIGSNILSKLSYKI